VRLALTWLAVGAVALAIGLAEGQAVRDIVRDVRWWLLYGLAAAAVWGGVRRGQVIRALLLGSTAYAVVVLLAAWLPPFESGLKDRALTYDWGLLRLQFSNNVLAVVAIAWVTRMMLRRPSPLVAAWLVVLAAAVLLSLTRMSIVTFLGVVGLTGVVAFALDRRRLSVPLLVRRSAAVAACIGAAAAVALASFIVGDRPSQPGRSDQGAAGFDNPVGRILFQDPNSGADAIRGGRLVTYEAAIRVIDDRPLIGSGLGTLVPVQFTFGGADPATPGMQPGVDNAPLTVALKSGLVGVLAFALLVAWPLVEIIRRRAARLRWLAVAWIGVLGLMMTQAFASSGYGPFGIALLIALPALRPGRQR
jgi:O-antigen ligase